MSLNGAPSAYTASVSRSISPSKAKIKLPAVPWFRPHFQAQPLFANHRERRDGKLRERVVTRSGSGCGCGCGSPWNWLHFRSRVTLGKQHLEVELGLGPGVFLSIHQGRCRFRMLWPWQLVFAEFIQHHLTGKYFAPP
ncbi:hypothetical protein HCH54_010280 [Aspergillus fumigatus]